MHKKWADIFIIEQTINCLSHKKVISILLRHSVMTGKNVINKPHKLGLKNKIWFYLYIFILSLIVTWPLNMELLAIWLWVYILQHNANVNSKHRKTPYLLHLPSITPTLLQSRVHHACHIRPPYVMYDKRTAIYDKYRQHSLACGRHGWWKSQGWSNLGWCL